MALTFSIKIPPDKSISRPREFRRLMREESRKAVARSVTVLLKAVKQASPVSTGGGTLRGSWKRLGITQKRGVTVSGVFLPGGARPPSIVGWVWDKGTKRKPLSRGPSPALLDWVSRNLSVDQAKPGELLRTGFAVAKAINRDGLPRGRNRTKLGVFTKAVTRREKQIKEDLGKILARVFTLLKVGT